MTALLSTRKLKSSNNLQTVELKDIRKVRVANKSLAYGKHAEKTNQLAKCQDK